jgi:hypothetical protein
MLISRGAHEGDDDLGRLVVAAVHSFLSQDAYIGGRSVRGVI